MFCKKFLLFFSLTCCCFALQTSGQVGALNRLGKGGFGGSGGAASDSLKRRDKNDDSITIYYKLFNLNEIKKLDSSIHDFFTQFPVPYTAYHLGNLGNASKSYLFNPLQKIGFDEGFHAFDIYDYTLSKTPFYQTTKPYTELGYLLGGKGEQLIEINHTQNKTQRLNYALAYRFSNAPGNVKNQQANLNNMRLTAHYQSKRKRYESFWVVLTNKTASSENGGLVNANLLDSLSLNNPYELETRLGVSGASFRNPFNTYIATGNTYQNSTYLWKQSYDLGQKDSVVKDTITTFFFYPRIRFQNEIKYQKSQFLFADANPDPVRYLNYFGLDYKNGAVLRIKDQWNVITNDFSIISYPQKTNSNQFLQLGIAYMQLNAQFLVRDAWSGYNIYSHATYKNKTKNQQWDLTAEGKLFLNGFNAGDYQAQISLIKLVSKKGNYLNLSFQNTNRTPSFNTIGITDFPMKGISKIVKENILDAGIAFGANKGQFKTAFNYQLINNYTYFSSKFIPVIHEQAISYLKGSVQYKTNISNHLIWYNDLVIQLTDPNAPIHLPTVLTRQRIAFEGLFFKNLDLSTGLELIYHSNYQPDNYMPFTGQFYLQNNYTTSNRPTANLFLHFLIKRLKGYIRLENMNTLLPTSTSLGNRYNFSTQHYPGTGLWFRVGIWWNFIN